MAEARAGAGPGLVDTHAHLNHPRLLRRIDEVIARARKAGVTDIIVVGYDLPSSERAVKLAAEHDGLWAAVGVHPHDAVHLNDAGVHQLRTLAKSDRVVAIGEIGLDFCRNLSPLDAQEQAFTRQLSLALELALPAIVHCRDAQDAVLRTLGSAAQPGVVWHCFEGSADQAEEALSLGVWLAFGGRLTHRNASNLRAVARDVPHDRLLLETDCPYLVPEPRRHRDNEPANVRAVAERLAQVRGESREHVARVTSENARHVFGLTGSCVECAAAALPLTARRGTERTEDRPGR
jgi:TatD DNase family protein